MKVVALSIALAIFIFLLLSLVLQNQITPPPPPPPQATFAAVSAEATRVAERATEMAAERHVEATTEAIRIWDTINGPNLAQNVLPTRSRATLVLRKDADHSVRYVRLRKI